MRMVARHVCRMDGKHYLRVTRGNIVVDNLKDLLEQNNNLDEESRSKSALQKCHFSLFGLSGCPKS